MWDQCGQLSLGTCGDGFERDERLAFEAGDPDLGVRLDGRRLRLLLEERVERLARCLRPSTILAALPRGVRRSGEPSSVEAELLGALPLGGARNGLVHPHGQAPVGVGLVNGSKVIGPNAQPST